MFTGHMQFRLSGGLSCGTENMQLASLCNIIFTMIGLSLASDGKDKILSDQSANISQTEIKFQAFFY